MNTLQGQVIPFRARAASPVVLSIIIVSYNTRDITRKCLEAVFQFPPAMPYEVIVVDNASRDGSAEMVSIEFPRARIIALSRNRGFAGGNNVGLRRASGRYILLLNSDAFIGPGVLESTVSYMEKNPAVGVLGCKLVGPDGSLQPCARMLPGHLNKFLTITGLASRFPMSRFFGRADLSWWDHAKPRKVGWVVGAYFLVRKEVFNRVGFLDERYFLYTEEVDFCRSAQKSGWNVVFYPHAQVVHLGGASISDGQGLVSRKGRQLTAHRIRSELRYYRKWQGRLSVLVSALMEISWQGLVYLKNLPSSSPMAKSRRQESLRLASLILSVLIKDRLGRVRRS